MRTLQSNYLDCWKSLEVYYLSRDADHIKLYSNQNSADSTAPFKPLFSSFCYRSKLLGCVFILRRLDEIHCTPKLFQLISFLLLDFLRLIPERTFSTSQRQRFFQLLNLAYCAVLALGYSTDFHQCHLPNSNRMPYGPCIMKRIFIFPGFSELMKIV